MVEKSIPAGILTVRDKLTKKKSTIHCSHELRLALFALHVNEFVITK